jgi:hypothetical protein
MTVSSSSIFRDLSTDKAEYQLDSSHFDFALLVNTVSGNKTLEANIDQYLNIFVA